MSTITRIIKDELAKYPVTFRFGQAKAHGYVDIDLPSGRHTRVHFNASRTNIRSSSPRPTSSARCGCTV